MNASQPHNAGYTMDYSNQCNSDMSATYSHPQRSYSDLTSNSQMISPYAAGSSTSYYGPETSDKPKFSNEMPPRHDLYSQEAPFMPISAGEHEQHHSQTSMWATEHYLVDSGIHTSASRSVASSDSFPVNGRRTGAGSECSDYYGSSTYSAADGLFLRVDNPSVEMRDVNMLDSNISDRYYPGVVSTSADLCSSSVDDDVPAAIDNLLVFLNEDDQQRQREAALLIYSMSQKRPDGPKFLQKPHIIKSIISAMVSASEDDEELLKYTLGTLYYISSNNSNSAVAYMMYQYGAIPSIASLLRLKSLESYAAATLHNLLCCESDEINNAIRIAGAVPILVSLLNIDHDVFLCIVADSLRILCLNNPPTKATVFYNKGLPLLMRLLSMSGSEKVLCATSRLLQIMSVCTEYKPSMLKLGAVELLAKRLYSSSPKLVEICLNTLLNLSDLIARSCNEPENLLDPILKHLSSNHRKFVIACSALLANLMCNNNYKAYTMQKNGMALLARTLKEQGRIDPRIDEEILSAIRQLVVSSWPGMYTAREHFLICGCFPLISSYFHLSPDQIIRYYAALKNALILISRLAGCGQGPWEAFRRENIAASAADLLHKLYAMIRGSGIQPPDMKICFDVITKDLAVLTAVCSDDFCRRILLERSYTLELINELASHSVVDTIKIAALTCRAAIVSVQSQNCSPY